MAAAVVAVLGFLAWPDDARPTSSTGAATVVIGDSLVVGAQEFLPANWHVNAQNGRSLRLTLSLFSLPTTQDARCVVVALGSNDVTADLTARQIAQTIQTAAAKLAATRCTLWITVKVEDVHVAFTGWRDGALAWNRALARLAPGAVLDWNEVAGEHPEYFLGDGLHMQPAGREAYAAFLRAGVRAATTPAAPEPA